MSGQETEKRQEQPRRTGRRPYPWAVKERLSVRLPEGFNWLVEQITAVLRRWNGTSVNEGVAVSEAVLLLARKLVENPDVTEGEKMVIQERAAVLEENLKEFYRQFVSGGDPIRPDGKKLGSV